MKCWLGVVCVASAVACSGSSGDEGTATGAMAAASPEHAAGSGSGGSSVGDSGPLTSIPAMTKWLAGE